MSRVRTEIRHREGWGTNATIVQKLCISGLLWLASELRLFYNKQLNWGRAEMELLRVDVRSMRVYGFGIRRFRLLLSALDATMSVRNVA